MVSRWHLPSSLVIPRLSLTVWPLCPEPERRLPVPARRRTSVWCRLQRSTYRGRSPSSTPSSLSQTFLNRSFQPSPTLTVTYCVISIRYSYIKDLNSIVLSVISTVAVNCTANKPCFVARDTRTACREPPASVMETPYNIYGQCWAISARKILKGVRIERGSLADIQKWQTSSYSCMYVWSELNWCIFW